MEWENVHFILPEELLKTTFFQKQELRLEFIVSASQNSHSHHGILEILGKQCQSLKCGKG